MSQALLSEYDLFKYVAEMDITHAVDEVFNGRIRFGGISLPEILEAQQIRLLMAQQGTLTHEASQLLRQLLTEHLVIGQQYVRLWLQPNPDPDELIEAWHLQQASMACWQQFVALFERSKDIYMAHEVAFQGFPPEALLFGSKEARHVFTALLKNEQQEFIGGTPASEIRILSPSCHLEGNQIHVGSKKVTLEPTHARLLDLLMTNNPVRVSEINRKLYGQRFLAAEQKVTISRKVYELNQKLVKVLGQPEGKRWIERVGRDLEAAYALKRPVGKGIQNPEKSGK